MENFKLELLVYDRAYRPGPGTGRALDVRPKPGSGRAHRKPGPGTGPEKSLNFPVKMVKMTKFSNEFRKLEHLNIQFRCRKWEIKDFWQY